MTKKDMGRLLEPRFVFKATAVNHIAYHVADYGRTRDFYIDLFGMACVFDSGQRCSVAFGNPFRILHIDQNKQSGDKPFMDHVGYSIEGFDLYSVKSELKQLGLAPEPVGDYAMSILDPDGYKIQICAEKGLSTSKAVNTAITESKVPTERNTAGPGAFKATAVNHIAYHVADYGRSRDFYMDLFGMKLMFEDGKKCSVAFGNPADAIYINPSERPDKAPYIDHLAISIEGFDLHAVADELKRLGLDPEPDGDFAWSILDPDGYKIQVCAEKGVYPGAAL